MCAKRNFLQVPVVGETYSFFDDGKIKFSRLYKAKVLKLITAEEAKKITFDNWIRARWDDKSIKSFSLYEIWQNEVKEHLQEAGFIIVGTGASTQVGEPYLYAKETDYFVECLIPDYDDDSIWFARTVDGGWFSMDITGAWQSGRLDVTGKLTKELEEEHNDD